MHETALVQLEHQPLELAEGGETTVRLVYEALAQAREAEAAAVKAGIALHRLEALRAGADALAALGRASEAAEAAAGVEAAAEALADAGAE